MVFKNDTLAANIRVMRARADMTQGVLADKTGIHIGTIVQYESGNMVPGADKVCAIASALGCTPNELFGWDDRRTR